MANRYGMYRTNDFGVRDEIPFRASRQSTSGMMPIEDDDGEFDFYADDDGDWRQARYDHAGSARSDFGLYDELAPYLADNEVVAMIDVGLDVDLDDVYHLVNGTWGSRSPRTEY